MSKIQHLYRRALISFFVVGLVTIGIGLFAEFVVVKNVLADATVVNIAGRQRMLSQRIGRFAALLRDPGSADEAFVHRRGMEDALRLFVESHEALLRGDLSANSGAGNSERVQQLFTELNPHFIELQGAVTEIISDESFTVAEHRERFQTIDRASDRFLVTMNTIVFQYDAEATQRIQQIRYGSMGATVLVILTLVFVWLAIIAPAVRATEMSKR